jgi:uncharacterized RDD family membrane protein YckC
MLNNIGLSGLLLMLPILISAVVGVYSIVNIPNSDENFNFAGFWLRFFAGIIDLLSIMIITLPLAVALEYLISAGMAGAASESDIQSTVEETVSILGLLVFWLYFTLAESSKFQATLGKKALGLRVVDMMGDRIGFSRANGRYFGKYLSSLTLFIGLFMMGWTKKKQSLHDKMAGCLVVRANSPSLQLKNNYTSKPPPVLSEVSKKLCNASDKFEAEALRRFQAGEISEDALMQILKSTQKSS